MALDFSIRPASPDDAPDIARILISLGWWDRLSPENEPEIQKEIRLELGNTSPERSRFVAADTQGRILGYTAVSFIPYLFLKGREGYLTELFVADQARGRGVGNALMEKVKQEAKERGCARLLLQNGKGRESYRRNFYAKQGWQERETTAIFIYDLG